MVCRNLLDGLNGGDALRIDALDLFKHRSSDEVEEDLGLELTFDEGFKLGVRLPDSVRHPKTSMQGNGSNPL